MAPGYRSICSSSASRIPSATGGQRSDVPIDSLRPEYGYQIPRWQIDANSLWRSNGRAQLPYEAKGYDYHAHVAYLQMLDERKQLGRANGEPIDRPPGRMVGHPAHAHPE